MREEDVVTRTILIMAAGSGGHIFPGLAIAKELSTALGGRIALDSEVGHGSRFELVLPV